MSLDQSAEIRDQEYRHGLIAAQIEVDLPLQLKALRKQRGWSQPEMEKRTGMKQSRFPLMERPGGAHFTLDTLQRLAEAFDVALIVKFAPFSEFLDWSKNFNPETFAVPSFAEEIGCVDADAIGKAQNIAGRLVPEVETEPASASAGIPGFERKCSGQTNPPRKPMAGAEALARQDQNGNRQGYIGESGLAFRHAGT
jgi:transcriptional regulator with XRE-family HTH domain